jgi:indolepyruvate ferredoxin oxidoreductase
VFAVLRSLKVLRGTSFDPFGYTRVRRVERELVGEYQITVEGFLPTLNAESYARCVELASLPDMIRGYEDVKLANVAKYRARMADLATSPLPVA